MAKKTKSTRSREDAETTTRLMCVVPEARVAVADLFRTPKTYRQVLTVAKAAREACIRDQNFEAAVMIRTIETQFRDAADGKIKADWHKKI